MRSLSLLLGGLGLLSSVLSSPAPEEKRLIEFAPDVRLWLSEEQLEEFVKAHEEVNKLSIGYFDVTDFQEPIKAKRVLPSRGFPSAPAHQSVVNPMLAQISTSNLRSYITTLSEFPTRYYTTSSSVDASAYVRDLMQSFVSDAGRTDANCTLYQHSWVQPSVLCRIEGQGPLADEIVITGAHIDSINSRGGVNSYAPGADDDVTGVASFIEAFRIMIQSGFRPQRSLEFMAYAAEEVGLRGSQDLARAYLSQGKAVYAVYQNEMSGYPGKAATIKVLQDYVDPSLTVFVQSLVDEYCDIPYEKAICGYGCSDHASWTKEGFPAVCTAEAGPFGEVNPYMHTDKDTVDKLDMDFTAEFAKLSLAFLAELSL